jgi:hypothetical protein
MEKHQGTLTIQEKDHERFGSDKQKEKIKPLI